jgi:hypothetical protein
VAQSSRLWLPITLAAFGAVSSLLTAVWDANSRGSMFSRVVFGGAIICGLAIFKALPNPFGAVALIFASVIAADLAVLASFGTQLKLGDLGLLTRAENWNMGNGGSPSPIALAVGGLVGGFLVGSAFLFAVAPKNARRGKLQRLLIWSLGSAGLAIVGWALSPFLGPILSPFLRAVRPGQAWLEDPQFNTGVGPIGMVSSVYFVWQVGMALAMGLTVQKRESKIESRGERP